jgi:hypothetical protein
MRVVRPNAVTGPDAPGDVLRDVKLLVDKADWNETTAMEVTAFKSRTILKGAHGI